MQSTRLARSSSIAIAFAISISALHAQQPARVELTKPAAQQAIRAFAGLPVPADQVVVTDTIAMDGDWVATVDLAGRAAHVKFKPQGSSWVPSEMAYQKDWVPLARGFGMLTALDEAGVRSTLRAIVSAQMAYSAVCGNFFFAPTLAALAVPEAGASSGFLGKELVPPPGATALEQYHYRIELVAPAAAASPAGCNGVPAGKSAKTFTVTARRQKGFAGKSYKVDSEGTLTEITK